MSTIFWKHPNNAFLYKNDFCLSFFLLLLLQACLMIYFYQSQQFDLSESLLSSKTYLMDKNDYNWWQCESHLFVFTVFFYLPFLVGLFQQAILLSGSALSPFAMANKPLRYARSLGKQLDCPNEDDQNLALIECLRRKSVAQLLSIKYQIPTHLTIFGPTVDKIVIPKEPLILMSEERSLFKKYNLIAGTTSYESCNLFNDYDLINGVDNQRKDRMIRTLVRNLFDYHLQVSFNHLSISISGYCKNQQLKPFSYNLYN